MKWTDRIAPRYKEAFKEGYNVAGMVAAGLASLAILNPLPLLAGVLAEAAYMLSVPNSSWYERRLANRRDAEVKKRRWELRRRVFPILEPDRRDRLLQLEDKRRRIEAQGAGGGTLIREVTLKLDYLLEKFIVFAGKHAEFSAYLDETMEDLRKKNKEEIDPQWADSRRRLLTPPPPAMERGTSDEPVDPNDRRVSQTVGSIQGYYDREMEKVSRTRAQQTAADTQAVLDRRGEVLQRRREYFAKLGQILVNLNHQLRLLEDTFGLISDEIRTRTPEQLLEDIDHVIGQTDVMTQVLEEVAPYQHMAERLEAMVP